MSKPKVTRTVLEPGPGLTDPPTPPLPQRLREAAEVIELFNAMAGLSLNCAASPAWLRREADVLEQEWLG